MRDIFTLILAGGRGERLLPLTQHRAKPAVPFAGKYRIIDVTLSNCLNSGLRKIAVLIQYKSHSLDRHLRRGWSIFNPEVGEFIYSVPPQQRISADWYRGTSDAVHQKSVSTRTRTSEIFIDSGRRSCLQNELCRHVPIHAGDRSGCRRGSY